MIVYDVELIKRKKSIRKYEARALEKEKVDIILRVHSCRPLLII